MKKLSIFFNIFIALSSTSFAAQPSGPSRLCQLDFPEPTAVSKISRSVEWCLKQKVVVSKKIENSKISIEIGMIAPEDALTALKIALVSSDLQIRKTPDAVWIEPVAR